MPIVKAFKDEGCAPVKIWTDEVEDSAMIQLKNLSAMPFIHKHIAVMPDVHMGCGSTIGSVIATKGAIIPAAVGVDIGCGMIAQRTELTAADLPDNLAGLRSEIEKRSPHGRTDGGGPNDRGAWGNQIPFVDPSVFNELTVLFDKHPDLRKSWTVSRAQRQIGTLGTGNHFVEICLDKEDFVWIMLHSGSRGIGNRIGTYFIERAKEDMRRWFINLPDTDLAYIPEGSELFDDYWNALKWAQGFAALNREIMMEAALDALIEEVPKNWGLGEKAINCHHNYVSRENHFGENVMVTRKGAVRARQGDLGIIPGSMGARSFIVRGLGNEESFCSCSHGAGRSMSRGEARRRYSMADLAQQTSGIECRKDADVIDEIPAAYKSIDKVMAHQADLVEVVAELHQIVCVKG